MNPKLIEMAADAMKISVERAAANYREVPDHPGLWHFWNPDRGGISVILNEAGEKLAVGSGIPFSRHLKAFLDGKRN